MKIYPRSNGLAYWGILFGSPKEFVMEEEKAVTVKATSHSLKGCSIGGHRFWGSQRNCNPCETPFRKLRRRKNLIDLCMYSKEFGNHMMPL
jgi:hypothetical protein